MDRPQVGSAGRALTQLDPMGQVEVDGSVFQAETSLFGFAPQRPPIPPDRVVVVAGWRTDKEHGFVLLVTDPTVATPETAGPRSEPVPESVLPQAAKLTPEERIGILERKLESLMQNQSRPVMPSYATTATDPGGGFGWLLLTFGQIVSVLGCIASPIYALMAISQLSAMRERVRDAPNVGVWIVFGAGIAFLYSAAMFVVFSRAKQVPPE